MRVEQQSKAAHDCSDASFCCLTSTMTEEVVAPIPNLTLPQHYFTLTKPSLAHLHAAARKALFDGIKADNMAPYYRLVAPSALPVDEQLLDEMTKINE